MRDINILADQIRRQPSKREAQLAYADLCAELGMTNLAEKLRRLGLVVSLAQDGKTWKVRLYGAIPDQENGCWTYTRAKDDEAYETKDQARSRAEEIAKQWQAPLDEFIVEGQVFWDESFEDGIS